MKSEYTRTGARRSGDDYQDIVALEVLVEILEHPNRYQWVRVEAADVGVLDDILALRTDGNFVAKQVKFSTHPELEDDAWTWKSLLEKRDGKSGELPSLLAKWSSSVEDLRKRGSIYEASVVSNRRVAEDIQNTLSVNGLVNFDKIGDPTIHDTIVQQLDGETTARNFFADFHFYIDRSCLDDLEESVRKRFYAVGGKQQGWLNLKDELRSWIRHRNQPSPDGDITLAAVKSAALWYQLQSLPQQFEVPRDYVLPSQDFHKMFVQKLLASPKRCVVLTASPGVGKSTYLSYLFGQLDEQNIPVVRHHYFLSLSDRSVGRLDSQRIVESLMTNIQDRFSKDLGEIGNRNPNPAEFAAWIEACGRHFAQQKKVLVIIIDGLDHVWREKRSIDELNKLFEYLLPPPDGIVILLGTQPLDDTQLPLKLTRSAPREQWMELPLLNQDAVKQWVQCHKDEINLPEEDHARDFMLDKLGNAFYNRSQGHPLHLRYTLKGLQEQNIIVTEENIKRLPGCFHQNITEYYKELWISLSEEGQEILHLFTACTFPWPSKGITECLDPQGRDLAKINRALKQVKHLMVHDTLGLRPFHSSILVFIAGQQDHLLYSEKMKQCALNWLRTSAPDYWRWAYEWLLEADLGNDQLLINGPNRQWAVEAITKCFSRQEASEILSRSRWAALQHEDLPRCIEVGLLCDYFNNSYEYRDEVFDTLLYPQLIMEEDPHLRARLRANISNLTKPQLVLLAENEASHHNNPVVHECFCELNERWKKSRRVSSDNWISQIGPILKVAAFANDIDAKKVVEFATSNREHGHSYDILSIYTKTLRIFRSVPPFRQISKMEMTSIERSVVLKHEVLLSFEEKFDLAHEVSLSENSSDTFVVIYAVLRKVINFKVGKIQFPSTELLSLKEHEHYHHRKDIEEFFYTTFFCFFGNHLCQHGNCNQKWLQSDVGDYSWPRSFLHRLNTIAYNLAQLFLSNSPPAFSWFYEQIKSFAKPSWPEDRDVYEYGHCAERAVNHIVLDIIVLGAALEKRPEIGKNDLELAFASDYCHQGIWIDTYVACRRKWLTEEAVKWLLQEQATQLASSIKQFFERASNYSTLASLATLHGHKTEAQFYVCEAASNLISYGDHKDILLYEALEVVEICHKINLPEARQWLLQLAPAIAKVSDFTDGDETNHLPQELADVLAEVAPDLLPGYYQWLCAEEDYYNALSVFHSFLKTADLSAEINQALARTAVDEKSLIILAERAEKGDQWAKTALSSLTALGGQSILNRTKTKEKQDGLKNDHRFSEESLLSPANFPPDRLKDYLLAAKATYFYRQEECSSYWLKFWKNAGQSEEAFHAIEEEENRGVELGNYDALFELALAIYGKEKAYPWLVKAHIRRGWSRYLTYKEESLRRWEIIKKHYSDQWFRFMQDTMKSAYGTVYEQFVRLVEYCLFMGQIELARQVSKQIVDSTLELVSPLMLPIPGWVNKS